jgi:hypothetical protein
MVYGRPAPHYRKNLTTHRRENLKINHPLNHKKSKKKNTTGRSVA